MRLSLLLFYRAPGEQGTRKHQASTAQKEERKEKQFKIYFSSSSNGEWLVLFFSIFFLRLSCSSYCKAIFLHVLKIPISSRISFASRVSMRGLVQRSRIKERMTLSVYAFQAGWMQTKRVHFSTAIISVFIRRAFHLSEST